MAVKKRGLGRGLDALLGAKTALEQSTPSDGEAVDCELRQIPVEQIQRGRYQPRREIDEARLQELADSIRSQGIVQPIVVRSIDPQRYEIIAGERRWRASQLAGLAAIPAVVRLVSEQTAMAMALIENIQRDDLTPLEEALALKRLVEEFALTHQQTAEAVGRSRAAVSNLLRLLELDPQVQQLLGSRKLEMGHARALLALAPEQQRLAAQRILAQGLSVRETEALVKRIQIDPALLAKSPAPAIDPDIRHLQERLSERLGAKVLLQHTASGSGRLVIQYNSLDELDGIIEHVK